MAKIKLKTKRGAAKRLKVTKGGVKFKHVNRNHILTKKAPKRKRQLRPNTLIAASDIGEVRQMLNLKMKKMRNYKKLNKKQESSLVQEESH